MAKCSTPNLAIFYLAHDWKWVLHYFMAIFSLEQLQQQTQAWAGQGFYPRQVVPADQDSLGKARVPRDWASPQGKQPEIQPEGGWRQQHVCTNVKKIEILRADVNTNVTRHVARFGASMVFFFSNPTTGLFLGKKKMWKNLEFF